MEEKKRDELTASDYLTLINEKLDKLEADAEELVKRSAELAVPFNSKKNQVEKPKLPRKKITILKPQEKEVKVQVVQKHKEEKPVVKKQESEKLVVQPEAQKVVPQDITSYVVAWNLANGSLSYLATKLNGYISEKKDSKDKRTIREGVRQFKAKDNEHGISYSDTAANYKKLKRSFKYSVFGINIFKRIAVWVLMRRAKKALFVLKAQEAYRSTDNKYFVHFENDSLAQHKKIKSYNATKVMKKLAKYQSKLSMKDKRDLKKQVAKDFKDGYFEKTKPLSKDILYYHAKISLFSQIAKDNQYSAGTRGAASVLLNNNIRKYNDHFENYQGTSEKLLDTLGKNG